jgi:wyosine [tRNA(Phe)-imidazoG37] synthetase (radical SAM superfamily)
LEEDMFRKKNLIAYGPVPSRRLGYSLGINNVTPKTCSYSCVYCQLGQTTRRHVLRGDFSTPKKIFNQVEKKLKESKLREDHIDYLTFVSNGEPTLDRNIGEEIKLLRSLGKKIAVISNASMLWKEKTRNDLYNADLISLKIDTVDEELWRETNRPHDSLRLHLILQGIIEFSQNYKGTLITESMLTEKTAIMVNEIKRTADFIAAIFPQKSYLSIPTRPPTEKWVRPPSELDLCHAFMIYMERGINVGYLLTSEGADFSYSGNVEDDLLSIASMHPMREDAVQEYLKRAHQSLDIIKTLLREGKLIETQYNSNKFFIRNFETMRK